jgi:hypothetical protein
MRNKENTWDGELPGRPAECPRNRIRSDLERMGLAPDVADTVARRLESTVAKLSAEEYGAVLSSLAAAYGLHRDEREVQGIAAEDIADVERLMKGFGEEVQKLDEGLRMLSAYVTRLRKRANPGASQTLH